jgi:hypothetical protein
LKNAWLAAMKGLK